MDISPQKPVTVLFDIDGTLVDSNYLHVDAWDRALVAIERPAEMWRIHRGIGMDSGKLLDELLGDEASTLGDAAKEAQSRFYAELSDRIRPFQGARQLLEELDARGHRVVLATSAPQGELDTLLEVLDVNQYVDVVTSSEDVGTAKPSPEIIKVALDKASVSAGQAIMVGDAVWDIQSAKRAGVMSLGVLTGGYSADELLSAGAEAVYRDVADLLKKLDESVITNSSA
ncbi:HAD superfamily hydrolase (TIGR01509 family) [Microbacterium halimionae]|uniref:HAD superfamily hydrolase (TIGR01509 family) n=1 Tax=Microbacterium halimionae TaxID=1526413 RepID=A0A7W3JQL3_9MICO|nr:HAD family hydrolase [Microbacterium halimionae]MBA8817190.1 HAD superfamily hydrolase (TIGR01509 family) [Microbacterium halimionae]NII94640.1 HAD superfamily hydrolase (TIGR01509 family) [Microbacterium halimionae]